MPQVSDVVQNIEIRIDSAIIQSSSMCKLCAQWLRTQQVDDSIGRGNKRLAWLVRRLDLSVGTSATDAQRSISGDGLTRDINSRHAAASAVTNDILYSNCCDANFIDSVTACIVQISGPISSIRQFVSCPFNRRLTVLFSEDEQCLNCEKLAGGWNFWRLEPNQNYDVNHMYIIHSWLPSA